MPGGDSRYILRGRLDRQILPTQGGSFGIVNVDPSRVVTVTFGLTSHAAPEVVVLRGQGDACSIDRRTLQWVTIEADTYPATILYLDSDVIAAMTALAPAFAAGGIGQAIVLAYAENPDGGGGDIPVTSTDFANPTVIVTAPAIVFDGATSIIADAGVNAIVPPAAGDWINLGLYEDGVLLGILGGAQDDSSIGLADAHYSWRATRRFTPSAGSHVYSIGAVITPASGGTGHILCAAGAPGDFPAYLLIERNVMELAYAENSAGPLAVTSTNWAAPNTLVTAPSVTFTGSQTVVIDCGMTSIITPAQGEWINLGLYEDGVLLGILGGAIADGSTGGSQPHFPCRLTRRMTPSAGPHVYSIGARVSVGTGHINFGAGGPAPGDMPAYIRITSA